MVVSCFVVTFSSQFCFQIYLRDAVCGICEIRLMMTCTVMLAKSDSDVMFCLQSYQRLRIDRSLVY